MRINYTTLAIALVGLLAAAVLLALGHDQVAAITGMVTTLMAAQAQQAVRAEATRATDVPKPVDTPTPTTVNLTRPKTYENTDSYTINLEDSGPDAFGPKGPK